LIINPSSTSETRVFYAIAQTKALVKSFIKVEIIFTKEEDGELPFVAVINK